MLATNLRAHSFHKLLRALLTGSIRATFAKAIAAGTKSESKSEPAPPVIRQEFVPMSRSFAVVFSDRLAFRITSAKIVSSLTDQPPTPPPRFICA